jgi:hypothetical protein
MIAPKRAVMIDHLSRAILNDIAQPSPEQTGHASESDRARAVARRRTKFSSRGRPLRQSRPLTCSTCQIAYLPTAVSPPTVALEDWACDRCRAGIEVTPNGAEPSCCTRITQPVVCLTHAMPGGPP